MALENKSPNRFVDAPRDKPQVDRVDRVEHANLERPGAQFHPRARGWSRPCDKVSAWRLH